MSALRYDSDSRGVKVTIDRDDSESKHSSQQDDEDKDGSTYFISGQKIVVIARDISPKLQSKVLFTVARVLRDNKSLLDTSVSLVLSTIITKLNSKYGREWKILWKPPLGKTVDYDPEGLIFFTIDDIRLLIWRSDPPACGCCSMLAL